MEKCHESVSEGTVQEGSQTNPEISQEEIANSEYLQSKQQLEKKDDSKQKQSFEVSVYQEVGQTYLMKTEVDENSFQDSKKLTEDEELEVVGNGISWQELENNTESSRDKPQGINNQAGESIHQECNVPAEIEIFETVILQQKTESFENNATLEAAGHDESSEVRKEFDRITEKAHLNGNMTLQEKVERSINLASLNSGESRDTLEDSEKVRVERGVGTLQKSVALSETEMEFPERENEVAVKERQLLTILANFFKENDKANVHEGSAIVFHNAKITEYDGNVAIADRKEESGTLTSHVCKTSEGVQNVSTEKVGLPLQRNVAPEVISETRYAPGEGNQETPSQAQQLKMVSNFFLQRQLLEITLQKDIRSFDNSGVSLQNDERRTKETIKHEGSTVGKNGYSDGHEVELPRDQSSELADVAKGHEPVKQQGNTDQKAVSEVQDYSGLREDEIPFEPQDSARKHDSTIPQFAKGYVSLDEINRNSKDARLNRQKRKKYVTDHPRESVAAILHPPIRKERNYTLSSPWKNYINIHPQDQNNTRGPPRPLIEVKEPPTHIWFSARHFNEAGPMPKEPKCVSWLLPSQESAQSPVAEEHNVAFLTQDRETENGKNISSPCPNGTHPNVSRILRCERYSPTSDDENVALLPMAVCPEIDAEIEEPRVQRYMRNLDAVVPTLPTGIRDRMRSISERCISTNRRSFCGLTIWRILALLPTFVMAILIVYYLFEIFTPKLDDNKNMFWNKTYVEMANITLDGITALTNFNFGGPKSMDDFDFGVSTPVDELQVGVSYPVSDFVVTMVTPINHNITYLLN